MNDGEDNNLLNEALLDLAIILKRNNDLRKENNELRKQIGDDKNESTKSRYPESNSY